MTDPKDPQAELREAISPLLDKLADRVWRAAQKHSGWRDQDIEDEILALFQAREQQLLTELKITNPGDVRTITPPITLEKGRFIVDAKGIIVAYLDQNKTNDGGKK